MIILSLSAIHAKAATRPDGYVEDVLSSGTVIAGDDGLPEHIAIPEKAFRELVEKYDPGSTKQYEFGGGPGTELKALLAKAGITSTPNCKCNSRAARMDQMELEQPGWCTQNIEEIVGWLREEATERGLPFFDLPARLLVKRAIANARRKAAARVRPEATRADALANDKLAD